MESQPETPKPLQRRPWLDLMRMLAAVWVFLFHFAREHPVFQTWPWRYVAASGAWGVSFFFMLSGYVLMRQYGPKGQFSIDVSSIGLFYKRRLLRIAPVYYATLFVFLFFNFFVLSEEPPLKAVILHLLCIQAWFRDYALSLNFPSWSLSCEAFFYLTFPLWVKIFRYFPDNIRSECARWGWLLPMVWCACGIEKWLGLYHPITNLPLFISGIFLALYRGPMIWPAAMAFLWLLMGTGLPYDMWRLCESNGVSASPVFACLILVGARGAGKVAQLSDVCRILGEISYPFYLGQYLSFLITKYLYWQFFHPLWKGFHAGHIFLINTCLALIFVFCVERPLRRSF